MSEIKYWMSLQKAWDKMVQVLFRPFDLGKWMVIGFAAFLANCGRNNGGSGSGLGSGSGHGGGSGLGSGSGHGGDEDIFREKLRNGLSEIKEVAVDAWFEYPGLIILIGGMILIFLVLLSLLVNWLNSRGQFVFLDNVIKNRGAVSEPWREYRKEANSLMIFQLLFNWGSGILSLGVLAGTFVQVVSMIMQGQWVARCLGMAVGFVGLLTVLCVVCGFVQMTLSHFVVPLMYQRRLSVLRGFQAFLPILRGQFWRIVLFGLVMILVGFTIGMATLIGILLTCCTALLLFLIPYISTVVLLPLFVFKRFVGLEFLRQFGSEYDLLAECNARQAGKALNSGSDQL